MNTFEITLDLDKRDVADVVTLAVGDKWSTTVRVTVLDHGAAIGQSGLSAHLLVRMPGGGTLDVLGTWSAASGTATFRVDESYIEGVGMGFGCVTLSDGDHKYSTSRFNMRVIRGDAQ